MITMLLHAALLAATPAATVDAPDDRWLAFSGCWRAESAPITSLLCIVPAADGVRVLDIENGVTRERRITADGRPRAVSIEGCSGFESATWSADGERVYLKSELKCGDRVERLTSGIFSFTTTSQWISIEAVTVGTEGAARTIRYQEVAAAQLPASVAKLLPDNRLARETARFAAVKPLDFADLGEALKAVEPRAAEALVIARGQPFDLDGRKLLALAAAGFPTYVIDAMVATSHPDVFEVREPVRAEQKAPYDAVVTSRDRYCDSFAFTPWLSPLDRYRCDRYGFYGYNDYYGFRSIAGGYYSPYGHYYNNPVIIIRDRSGSDSESSGGRASRQGYRRGTSTGTEQAQPRSTPSASRPSSSSGSGDANSSGSSSSGSGRTAKPRDN